MIAFANYAAMQIRAYKTVIYDMFADICDKIIAGNEDAIFELKLLVKNAQMDMLREQKH